MNRWFIALLMTASSLFGQSAVPTEQLTTLNALPGQFPMARPPFGVFWDYLYITNMPAAARQTPWLSDIDGNNHTLTNIWGIQIVDGPTGILNNVGDPILSYTPTAVSFWGPLQAGPLTLDSSANVTLESSSGKLRVLGRAQFGSTTVTNAQTNLFLSPSQLVGSGPQRQLVDVFIGAGLTLSGSPLTLSGTGGAGGWGNLEDKGTNETALGYFVFVNPTNSNNGTNWTFFTGTNWAWSNVGTNGGGGYKTNTFYWGNGSTSNVLHILNPSGQTIVIGNTNGVWRWGTNNQMVLDTSGNLTISGQFNGSGGGLTAGSVPLTALPQVSGFTTIANPNAGNANVSAVSTASLLDPLGTILGGLAIRGGGFWTNSGASAITALLSSANVTNVLNALSVGVTNQLTLYGVAPGSVITVGTANGISNTIYTTSGSNDLALAAGNSTFFRHTNGVSGIANLIVTNALSATNGTVFLNRTMSQTNAIVGYSVPLDFSVGNYQFIITNNDFTISGFKNYTNGWVNWVTLVYSNSHSSAHTFTWGSGLVQYGTNTGTSVSVPAGKQYRGTFVIDHCGTNLYGAVQSN